jgi:hypothetical protein
MAMGIVKRAGETIFFFVSSAALAFGISACVSIKPAARTIPIESRASEVKSGMSPESVGRILGEFSHESFEASSASFSCRSYPYGEAADTRFVIVYFDYESTGKPSAETATDGHLEPCALPGDVL